MVKMVDSVGVHFNPLKTRERGMTKSTAQVSYCCVTNRHKDQESSPSSAESSALGRDPGARRS